MKLLFTDLDGTLLNDDSRISSGTKAFLDDFLLAGNKLILASGRPLLSVLEVKEKAGLTQSGIFLTCNNGTLIYDCDRSLSILEKRLPLSYVPYLQEQADKYHLHIQTYRDDAIVSPAEDAEIQYYRRKIHLPLIISPALQDALTEGPYKMLAVHFLCNYFNVPLRDAYAAGDADNDISMLLAAGTGIAMQNASKQVKQKADIVTDTDNNHDGLANTMRRLLNI